MTVEHDIAIHDQGFRDGVRFVARHLRVAAERIEKPIRDTFASRTSGHEVQAISRSGQPHLARKYRELADELERLITQ